MRAAVLGVAVLFVTTATLGRPKKPPKHNPALDIPSVVNAGSATEHSVITVWCLPVYGSLPRKAQCSLSQVSVGKPPDAAAIAGQIAELEKLFKGADKRKRLMKEGCSGKNLAFQARLTEPPETDFTSKLRAACAANDADKMLDAMRWHLTDVEARTCKLTLWAPSSVEFTQLDANTWTATTSPSALCNAVTTMTLWRKPGDFVWSYKQVTSVPPNADPKLCAINSAPAEWRWDAAQARDYRCKYIQT
jgi:hypothetical protein